MSSATISISRMSAARRSILRVSTSWVPVARISVTAKTDSLPVDFSKRVDPSNLQNQSILVTGGANGIGRAFVEYTAVAGAYVTAVDIMENEGKKMADTLQKQGRKVQFIKGDVSSWEDQVKAFEAAVSFSPSKSLDIVLPVAGLGTVTISRWLNDNTNLDRSLHKPDTQVVDVNMTGTLYSLHLALHHFKKTLNHTASPAKSKQIVFLGSLAGYLALPRITSYSATKYAIRGMWRTIRDDPNLLGKDVRLPLRASLIAPWFVSTNMTKGAASKLESDGLVMATTDDVVSVLSRILCDESVVGRALAVAPRGESFDLCDDVDGFDAGRELNQRLSDGVFGVNVQQINDIFLKRT